MGPMPADLWINPTHCTHCTFGLKQCNAVQYCADQCSTVQCRTVKQYLAIIADSCRDTVQLNNSNNARGTMDPGCQPYRSNYLSITNPCNIKRLPTS